MQGGQDNFSLVAVYIDCATFVVGWMVTFTRHTFYVDLFYFWIILLSVAAGSFYTSRISISEPFRVAIRLIPGALRISRFHVKMLLSGSV